MAKKEPPVLLNKSKGKSYELIDLLKGYTKSQLMEIAVNLHQPVKKSWKKETLMSLVEEVILEQVETIYSPTLIEILEHFPDKTVQAYRIADIEEVKAFYPLINKGFFTLVKEKSSLTFIIPDEVHELIGTGEREEISSEDKLSIKKEILMSWQQKMLDIYGVYHIEYIETIWNRHFEDKVTIEELNNYFN